MLIFVILIGISAVAQAEPQFHRVQNAHEGRLFYQEWIIDEENEYVVIVSTNGQSKPSINIHDLKTRFSAVKDIDLGVCFLEMSNHTIERFRQRIQELDNNPLAKDLASFTWACDKTPLTNEQIQTIAGDKIARFCNEYNTVLVKRFPQEYTRKRSLERSAKFNSYYCGFCILSTSCPPPSVA